MNVQDIFYLFGIIFMLLVILMLLGTAVLLYIIKNKVSALHKSMTAKVHAIKKYRQRMEEIAEDAGALLAATTERSHTRKRESK
jgi:cytochrome c-type biogenesis protein CcmH/NrfG